VMRVFKDMMFHLDFKPVCLVFLSVVHIIHIRELLSSGKQGCDLKKSNICRSLLSLENYA